MRSFRPIALPLCTFLGACVAGDSPIDDSVEVATRPLIGGAIANDDPAVVALLSGGSSSAFCTATLISPSVVLTAAHCIDMAGADPNIIAFFGTDVASEGTRIGIGRKTQHINWNGSVGNFDIGLLLLNFPQDPFLPVPLNTSTATDHSGEPYRHVGFGVYDRQTMAADGKKREGTTAISGFQNDVILSGDDQVSVCFGDSGGPAFLNIDGTEHVAGIHSFTSGSSCLPPNGDTRVDLYVDNFILPWIQDNDPVCKRDSVCGPIGCTDDPDCEPCGADGTCTTECALPDPDCPTSAMGEICQADSQCMGEEAICVFWSGDSDYHFCTNECTPGSDTCPSGMSCQSVMPFGNICYYDEDPPGVLGDSCAEPIECGTYVCEDSQCTRECDLSKGLNCPEGFECDSRDGGQGFYCFSLGGQDSGGGCNTSGSGAGDLVALLMALGIFWRRRRSCLLSEIT